MWKELLHETTVISYSMSSCLSFGDMTRAGKGTHSDGEIRNGESGPSPTDQGVRPSAKTGVGSSIHRADRTVRASTKDKSVS